jgi:hypothetical protein
MYVCYDTKEAFSKSECARVMSIGLDIFKFHMVLKIWRKSPTFSQEFSMKYLFIYLILPNKVNKNYEFENVVFETWFTRFYQLHIALEDNKA